MVEIIVARAGDGEPMRFDVSVLDDRSSTEHRVTLSRSDLERLGPGRAPEDLVRACFGFLLEREPKESILPSFDISVIGRYFPEFEREILERWPLTLRPRRARDAPGRGGTDRGPRSGGR